jgi:GntR family transcriptional regulator/MocR family aminotransferase
MLLVNLDRQSKTPLFKQVYQQLKKMMDQQVLKPGEKLPSSRLFANHLGVNRTTIYRAYEELWSMGYIDSRSGSYSTVRKRAQMAVDQKDENKKQFDWSEVTAPSGRDLATLINERDKLPCAEDCINFRPLSPDTYLMPANDFRKCLNQAINDRGAALLQYGDPMGYEPLRDFIATRMRLHGISVTNDQILITNGIQNGLELILKLLSKRGLKIVVETPTYSSAILLFKHYNAEIIGIPVGQKGMDLKKLEPILSAKQPSFVYTIPNFHNPTGITTSQSHRERLLHICEKHNVPIVEDGFEEEMKYFGKVVLPIKSMDHNDIDIYLGTFSKVLFPGLRIGWIIANERLIQQFTALKRISDLSGNDLNQAALELFCRSGQYDLHIKRTHRVYRKRMQAAMKAIREYLPEDKVVYTKPLGGYTIWMTFNIKGKTETELIEYLGSKGIALTPGSYFFPKKDPNLHARISIAHLIEDQIWEGIKRLGEAIKAF